MKPTSSESDCDLTDHEERFDAECAERAASMAANPAVQRASRAWMDATLPHKYSYNFRWLGRPIIQYPADVLALQEIIWAVRPQLIIECGVAHGGLTVFLASMQQLVAENGRVLGVDVEVRRHNRAAIEAHPTASVIGLIEGSSVERSTVDAVRERCPSDGAVMVVLDSNHTHEHVLAELRHYAPMVTPGSYIVVLDTIIEDLPGDAFGDRPWSVGNNPKTAVHQYLREDDRFEVDTETENKLLLSTGPHGYLLRVR